MRDKEKQKEYKKAYRRRHPEKDIEYRIAHKKEKAVLLKAWRKNNPEKCKAALNKYNHKIKKEVLTYYGNGILACTLCGFDNLVALSIDHINGGGCKHRKEVGMGGVIFYRWLKKNNFPIGYRTLCYNCQMVEYHGMKNGR
jgi:hypothetical protein